MVRILFPSVPTSCCSSSGMLSSIFLKAHQTLSRFPVGRISIINMNSSMFLLLKPALYHLLEVVAARSDLPLRAFGWCYSKNVKDDSLLEEDLPAEVASQQQYYQCCTNQQLCLSAHKNLRMIVHHSILSRK